MTFARPLTERLKDLFFSFFFQTRTRTLPLTFLAWFLTTSCNLSFVKSQAFTSGIVCCPVHEHRYGVHVHCSDTDLTFFSWSRSAKSRFDPVREEVCVSQTVSTSSASEPTDSSSQKVVALDLSGNSLVSFPELSHGSLGPLQYLNLSHNAIPFVPGDALLSLQDLDTLDLSFNRLSVVSELSPLGFPGLVSLNLSHNAIDVISPKAFGGLFSLQTLSVSHNQLSDLTSDCFADLQSLETLRLDSNSLESLPVSVFDELSQLLILDLSGNRLLRVHKLLFQSLSRLKILNMSNNALSQIPLKALRHMPRLETLDLSSNNIHNISGGIFEGLTKLVRLELAHNDLKAISANTFKGLDSLKHLDLSRNRLATIRKASFTSLHSLLWLSLRSNVLKRLHEHLFAGLKWLDHLDLSHNELKLDQETFPPELFSPVRNLHSLYLDHNDDRSEGRYPERVFDALAQLRYLSIDTYTTVDFGDVFAELSRLKTLDLPGCKIKTLTNDSFRGFRESSLLRLRLDGCPLQEIEGCAFCGFKNLEELSVTGRLLVTVPAEGAALKTRGTLIGPENTSLRKLNLSGLAPNPDMIQSLADRTLKNLDQLEVLDLSSNNLRIGVASWTVSESVKQLLLSGNRFESIPVELIHLRHLVLLDMSDNDISSLPSSQREALDRLAERRSVTLRLPGNELKCPRDSCENVDFLNWLCFTTVNVDNGPAKGCNSPCTTAEGKTTSVEEALQVCQGRRHPWLYVAVTALCALLVTTAVRKCAKLNRSEDVIRASGNQLQARAKRALESEPDSDRLSTSTTDDSDDSAFAADHGLRHNTEHKQLEQGVDETESVKDQSGDRSNCSDSYSFLSRYRQQHQTRRKEIEAVQVDGGRKSDAGAKSSSSFSSYSSTSSTLKRPAGCPADDLASLRSEPGNSLSAELLPQEEEEEEEEEEDDVLLGVAPVSNHGSHRARKPSPAALPRQSPLPEASCGEPPRPRLGRCGRVDVTGAASLRLSLASSFPSSQPPPYSEVMRATEFQEQAGGWWK